VILCTIVLVSLADFSWGEISMLSGQRGSYTSLIGLVQPSPA